MAKQITLKAPGNRQSLQSMSSGSPVGHRTFWPLTQTIGQGFGEGGHRDLARRLVAVTPYPLSIFPGS